MAVDTTMKIQSYSCFCQLIFRRRFYTCLAPRSSLYLAGASLKRWFASLRESLLSKPKRRANQSTTPVIEMKRKTRICERFSKIRHQCTANLVQDTKEDFILKNSYLVSLKSLKPTKRLSLQEILKIVFQKLILLISYVLS